MNIFIKLKDFKAIFLKIFGHTKKALGLSIIILLSLGCICNFLMFVGIFPYPKWYLISNFHINKKHFEIIINCDECDYLDVGQNCNNLNISDLSTKSALKILFEYGIYESFSKQYESHYEHSIFGMTKVENDNVIFCVFYPKNYRDASPRGIVYSKDEIYTFTILDNVCICYPIEDDWYYFEYAYKEKG